MEQTSVQPISDTPTHFVITPLLGEARGISKDVAEEARRILLGESPHWKLSDELTLLPIGDNGRVFSAGNRDQLTAAIAALIYKALHAEQPDAVPKESLKVWVTQKQNATGWSDIFPESVTRPEILPAELTPEQLENEGTEIKERLLSALSKEVEYKLQTIESAFVSMAGLGDMAEGAIEEKYADDPYFFASHPKTRIGLESAVITSELNGALDTARQLHSLCGRWKCAGIDVMRWHNTHPEAVNFVRLYPELSVWERVDNPKAKTIEDIPAFAASYWPLIAGSVGLQVSPEALEAARLYYRAGRDRLDDTGRNL